MVFAIVCLGGMAGDRPLKTFIAALIGLFLACVGIDANSGVYRFTGDNIHLTDGIQFVVLVLGIVLHQRNFIAAGKNPPRSGSRKSHWPHDVQFQGSVGGVRGEYPLWSARLRHGRTARGGAILCLKAGNSVILRGGSEAHHSNQILGALLRRA